VGVQGQGDVAQGTAPVEATGLHDDEDAFDKAAACFAVAAQATAGQAPRRSK